MIKKVSVSFDYFATLSGIGTEANPSFPIGPALLIALDKEGNPILTNEERAELITLLFPDFNEEPFPVREGNGFPK